MYFIYFYIVFSRKKFQVRKEWILLTLLISYSSSTPRISRWFCSQNEVNVAYFTYYTPRKHWFYCRKLRDYLQSIGVVRNDSRKIILNTGDITIGHHDLTYQLHVYENVIEPPKVQKLCHLKVFEIKVIVFINVILSLKLSLLLWIFCYY